MTHAGPPAPRRFMGVMVSGTFEDFKPHREALIRAISGQGLHPIAMEHDSALSAGTVVDSSLQKVRDAAAYVGIIGTRYGDIRDSAEDNPEGLSLTELEFREARDLGRPILLFVIGPDHDVKQRDVEQDPEKRRKLEAFREDAKRSSADSRVHRVYKVFNSPSEFEVAATQLVAELRRFLDSQAVPAVMTGGGGAAPGAPHGWRWDVAMSFAGAQRDYVEQVAGALTARGMRCFYDADEQIELWGKYLAEELPAIYAEQAAAVVVFVSAEYAARDWTRLERRVALARAVHERREYVLPARFDDTPLPGLLSDMVTIDLRGRSAEQFAAMIAAKLAALGIVVSVPQATVPAPYQAAEEKWGDIRGDFSIANNPYAEVARSDSAQARLGRTAGDDQVTDPNSSPNESSAVGEDRSTIHPAANIPVIWGNVPQRNKNFMGHEDVLHELRRRFTSEITAALPHALHGLGGVGKTQLAIEYAYRYADQYQVVWWIPADQVALIRSTLAALAPRLGITVVPPGRVEDAMAAVLDALRRGEPFDRWLLIFDNADQPESIRAFMPYGPGHVIVTSRNRGWDRFAESLEVNIFTRDDSLSYLQRRVKGITRADADRLAEELGDLPLALDQAAALLTETVMTVDIYLRLLSEESDRILGENPASSDYPLPVAVAWSLSVTRLQKQAPHAMELLQRCAFFGPAPIPLDLLDRGRYVLGPPLQDTLRDPIMMGRAIRALGRYSLAQIDNSRRTLQVHRIIQRLIRNELGEDDQFAMRHEVHLLLAASDPADPDDVNNWPKYADLLAHVGPSELVTCRTDFVRRLARNFVHYLYISGNYNGARTSADKALTQWTADSGEDNQDVLIMARQKAQVLRAVGRYQEAYEIAARTFERMRTVLGDDHEETLILMNGLYVDRLTRGDFRGSLELTEKSLERHRLIFGNEHPCTFAAMSTLAESFELNSRYAEARELNLQLYDEKVVFYLSDSHPQVLFTLNALSRVLREQGYFLEARETAKRAYDGYGDLVRQHTLPESHPWVLQQEVDFSTALRAAGTDPESLELAHEAYNKFERAFGPEHGSTLAAAFNLANAQRVSGDLEHAGQVLETTERRCRITFGEDHPYTLAGRLNLSIVRRRQGEAEIARSHLTEIHAALSQTLGPNSHPALICAVNLANALAELGKMAEAVNLGEEILPQLIALLGPDHPHNLTCAANLALDLRAAGQTKRAADLANGTLAQYRRALGDEHPEVRAAAAGQRQDLGIDIPVLF